MVTYACTYTHACGLGIYLEISNIINIKDSYLILPIYNIETGMMGLFG